MTKLVSSILLFIFISIPIYAQESIGFSDSTDFQYIIDYRLPDWGYSNFYLSTGRFRTANDYRSTNLERVNTNPDARITSDSDIKSHTITLALSPAYQYYRQSELQILSLNTNLDLGTGIQNHSNKSEGSSTDDSYIIQEEDFNVKNRDVFVSYSIDINSKYYAWNELFISGGIDGYVNFSKDKSKRNDELYPDKDWNENEFYRYISFRPQLGIGFGRVRNVAPQIRAIRLKERYQEISDQSFTNNEIIESAEQFTRIQQYKSTRDRHQKYFWSDMNELLSGKLDEVFAYDLFYLNDVLNENLGQRYEGFDIRITGRYGYQNSLRTIDGYIGNNFRENRNLEINRWAGAVSNLRWYKNLSINHQLSFVAEYAVSFSFEKSSFIKYDTDVFANFSWLWTITDRYFLTTSLRNSYSKPIYKDRIQNYKHLDNETSLSNSFSYFIENRLSLTGSLSANFDLQDFEQPDYISDKLKLNWSAAVSLRYYFARNLF